MEVLRLVSCTQIDDLPPVIDTLIETFEEDVIPVAYDVATELVCIFIHYVLLLKSKSTF